MTVDCNDCLTFRMTQLHSTRLVDRRAPSRRRSQFTRKHIDVVKLPTDLVMSQLSYCDHRAASAELRVRCERTLVLWTNSISALHVRKLDY